MRFLKFWSWVTLASQTWTGREAVAAAPLYLYGHWLERDRHRVGQGSSGQHTEEILHDLLQFDAGKVASLRELKIV